MEPHPHCLHCLWIVFMIWLLLVIALLSPCWQDLFGSVFLDCNPSQFNLQVCFHIFAVSSLPACGSISLFLHCIVDSMICFSQRCLFRLTRAVWRLGSYWEMSNWTSFASISWIWIRRFSPHKISYFLFLGYASLSFFAQYNQLHCLPIRFICVSNIWSDYFKKNSVWN